MKRLDPLAVSLEGIQLIEASAGTGKTHTITTLFVRLLLERRIPIDRILVVTFTKAATAELRERVRRRLGEALAAFEGRSEDPELGVLAERSGDRAGDRARIEAALADFDRAAIFTIHGFCQRALGEHALESGLSFDLELVTDDRALVAELVADFWSTELGGASPAQVAFVLDGGNAFERWRRLALEIQRDPELRVEPAARPSDHEPALARYLELRERARRVLANERPAIEAMLSDPSVLKQGSYPVEAIPERLEELASWVAGDEPTLSGFGKEVLRFAQAALVKATKNGQSPPRHELFELCEAAADEHDAARCELEAWRIGLEHRLAERVRSELPRRKRELGLQTFDDLLGSLDRALSGPEGETLAAQLVDRFPVALVDEFQDTDPIQYRIFRRVQGRAGALFLIGDPKQAIYAFRGADIFSYLQAAEDAGEARHTLGVSYRSDPGLVIATNVLFSRAHRPFVLEGIEPVALDARPGSKDELGRRGGRAPSFQIALVSWEAGAGEKQIIKKQWSALPRRVAAQVAALLGQGLAISGRPLHPGDIAVLTRTNDQAFEIQRELAKLAVPSVLFGDKSVLDRDEAEELSRIMRALAAPTSESAVVSALATSIFGLRLHELRALRDDPEALEAQIEGFRRWQTIWREHGFVHAFRALLRDKSGVARLLRLVDGERRLTNFLHLGEIVHRAALEQRLGISGVTRWFDEVRNDVTRRGDLAPEALQLRLESDARAVKLTTMHKSKGLEYEVVLCPHLWDGSYLENELVKLHDKGAGGHSLLSLDPAKLEPERRRQAELEYRAESMRLCYVALTRARRLTSVVWGPFRTSETSPLGALLHATGSSEAPAQRIQALAAAGLAKDLGRLEQELPLELEITELARSADRRREPGEGKRPLKARPISRRIQLTRRASSFSALAQSHEPTTPLELAERDVDAISNEEATTSAGQTLEARVALDLFPRGARAGEAIHEVLERIDFTEPEPSQIEPVTRESLARHGIALEHAPVLATALSAVLRAPLTRGAAAVRLVEVPRTRRLVELEFTFPVRAGRASVDARALARPFAAFPEGLAPGYSERVRALDFAPLSGFLRGFVDLVIEHGGRYWVIDYKSNHLGGRAGDYGPAALERAMNEHHYYLQYHLYVVALCRYLSTRVPSFDYETSFGGALYLFLRGVSPEHEPGTGVFFERPPKARIDALDEVLSRGEEATR